MEASSFITIAILIILFVIWLLIYLIVAFFRQRKQTKEWDAVEEKIAEDRRRQELGYKPDPFDDYEL
ncbi:hypothetical protein N9A26_00030 [bacterium]|nr:hypothetical protein [bacterium]